MSETLPIALPSSALAAIDGLPDELLSEIFICTHDILVQSEIHLGGKPMCVRLSHVSRRWRSVAIACQYLWAQIPGDFWQEWTMTCLQRAHSVPLDLDLVNLTNPYDAPVSLMQVPVVYVLVPRPRKERHPQFGHPATNRAGVARKRMR